MKKFITISVLITTLSISSAFAKTEGHYLGIDLLRTATKIRSNSTNTSDQDLSKWYNHNRGNSDYGVGLNYKYAFNINNFFIAPSISYDLINSEVKSSFSAASNDQFLQTVKLNSRLNFQTNFGYDISDKFAAYVPLGISSFSYEIRTSDTYYGNMISSKKTGNESAFFFGLGFSYKPTKNTLLNLEYNRFQTMKLTSNTATLNKGNIKANIDVNIVKLGVSYKF